MSHDPDPPTHRFARRVPEGDNRQRLVCGECGFIAYENPKVVVGSVCAWRGRVLLCRRAIDPRSGYWTIPAGFLEQNETTAAGAMREAWEEAHARIEIDALLAVYSIPRLSQVQIMYRAALRDDNVSPGAESEDVRLFDWADIPWSDLAFPSVRWVLTHYRDVEGVPLFAARGNPPGEFGDR